MRKIGCTSLHSWLLIFLYAFIIIYSQSIQGIAQQARSNETWVREKYASALDVVFHDVCSPSASQKSARWTACIQVIPAFRHELESRIYLEKSYTGSIEARAFIPKDRSIYDQLVSLRLKNPGASLSDLCQFVRVNSVIGDQNKFPALIGLGDEFDRLKISVAISDELTSDPTKYYLHVRSYTGNELDVTLYGPETNASQNSDPLLRWEYKVRSLLTKDEK